VKELCEGAYKLGEEMDLADVHYGPHSRTKRYYETTGYYPLLAGLAKKIGAKSALDIGTHFGGSARALLAGMPGGHVVTVDVKQRNAGALRQIEGLMMVTGDSIDPDTVRRVTALLASTIDILYIDSFHNYEHTMKNISLYSSLSPKFVVMDDIIINDSMKEAWAELSANHPTFDATALCTRNCGFGVVDLR
jgi:cephalosporin hydroxylase